MLMSNQGLVQLSLMLTLMSIKSKVSFLFSLFKSNFTLMSAIVNVDLISTIAYSKRNNIPNIE